MKMLDQEMKKGIINGIKIFPSYFPRYPNDSYFKKYYRLCIKHDVPAIIHSGAVMKSKDKKVYQKYAHPLPIDDLAVDHPDLKILMAHSGYPWLIDAAQIAYKNDNVYLDLSGLREGPIDLRDELDKHWISWLIGYLEDDEKVMYGSDWPIVRMGDYIKWLKKMVPRSMHKKFFYENARVLFKF
jgi:predicted TIM-barrel fold metal-dependent hydrolase